MKIHRKGSVGAKRARGITRIAFDASAPHGDKIPAKMVVL